MRRTFGVLFGFAAILALIRLLRRRHSAALPGPAVPTPVSPHAEELRRKLAESRAADIPPVEEPEEPAGELTIDEERQRVHSQARSVLEEMRSAEPPTS